MLLGVLADLIGVLTGHWLNILSDVFCKSCMEEIEMESFRHFFHYYPTFAKLKALKTIKPVAYNKCMENLIKLGMFVVAQDYFEGYNKEL